MAASAVKIERIEVRVPAELKRDVERAADLTGRSITDFVTGVVEPAVRATLADHARTVLAEADREAFFAALENPPKPTAKLRDAADRYKDLIVSRG